MKDSREIRRVVGDRGSDAGSTAASGTDGDPEQRAARRAFLSVASAGLAGLALAPGIRLLQIATADEPSRASSTVRWGMLVDANRCKSDCDACVQACNRENGLSGGTAPTDSQWIRTIKIHDERLGRTVNAPVMCQHCAEPPCVDVCPTGASFKRADGIVLVDRHSCIGCRYCMMACPYKARSFVHEPVHDQRSDVPRGKGCVESCTMCVHRIDRGASPACVEACPEGVFTFGNMNDPDSAIAQRLRTVASTQIRADLKLNTGVRYEGLGS